MLDKIAEYAPELVVLLLTLCFVLMAIFLGIAQIVHGTPCG